jgi:putative peptidoglycan lipid II flippase
MTDRQAPRETQSESFFGAARTMAALTLVSRVAGLVREAAITALGATAGTDAFRAAFAIPNLFRRLFGEGAMAAAFVPVFTESGERDGAETARAVLANTIGWLAGILAALTALIELALGIYLLTGPGAYGALVAQLVMIVLPFMFTVCLLALASAALQCRGRFAYPAFAPILLNLFLIAAAIWARSWRIGDQWQGLFLLAGSVIAAGMVQLLGAVWMLRRVGLLVRPRMRPVLPAVRRIARLSAVMILPLGLMQFSAFYDRFYILAMTARPGSETLTVAGLTVAKPLAVGVVTCFDNAARLYQLPLGILAISLATAVFPLFSRYAAAGDLPGLRRATNKALRLSIFLGLPCGVALAILAEPIVTVLFLRGRYTPADAARAAYILRFYCAGMWAYFVNHILLRAFFAQQDARTPLRISAALTLLNIALVTFGIFTPLGEGALGLATAGTAAVNAVVLSWILRLRWGRIGGRSLLAGLGRTLAATGALAGAIYGAVALVDTLTGPGPMTRAAGRTVAGVVAGTAAFLVVAAGLRSRELGELLRRPAARTAPPTGRDSARDCQTPADRDAPDRPDRPDGTGGRTDRY